MHPLERLFRPRSVAVLGASPDPAKPSYRFVEGLVDAGYRGAIHLINPRGGEAFGRPLLPSLERVDGEIDLVLSMLGPAQTPGAIAATARRGARFAVIFTAGFAEMSAEGAAQQAQMVADAHASGMRVVGPNCMGIFSLDCGLNLTGQLGLRRGPVGMISQSGNVGLTVWYEAPKLDIGFSKFIGFGNQADIPVHEYLDYMGQDPETGVVVMYLEGLQAGLGPEFVRVAREVSRVKPIGRSRAAGPRTPAARRGLTRPPSPAKRGSTGPPSGRPGSSRWTGWRSSCRWPRRSSAVRPSGAAASPSSAPAAGTRSWLPTPSS